ncbi:MAG: TraR/DksA C4-type zinc finger protein [Rhodospirillaceae bacterium]|jgi:DnaK suppressor protein|nr:TraR/DksA C4-type zinc finger protein [Rhodospirillaceae bacterium]
MQSKPKLNLNALRRQLDDRKAKVLANTASTTTDRRPVELDQSMQGRLSRIDALQQREMALATQRRREIEIMRIESALKRIDANGYGYCASCDEDIAIGRLKSDPAEPLCIECASDTRR